MKSCARLRVDVHGKRLKRGDKVTIRGGFFSGKLGKRGTPGVIVGWPGCEVADVRANVPSYDRRSVFAVGVHELMRRK